MNWISFIHFVPFAKKSLFVEKSFGLFITAEHRDTDAVSFNNIDAKPNHILLPGDLHVTLNLTFNRQIEHAYLDFELYRHILGFPLKIPCIHGTIIGSW